MRRSAAAAVVAGLLAVGAGLSGCSSDGGTTAATSSAVASSTASTAAVCASADSLRSSLSALADVQVVQEGTAALTAAWNKVQDDWGQFADDARSRYSGDVDSVQADADAAGNAVQAATSNPSAQTIAAAGTAIGTFLTSAGALVDKVRSTC